MPDELRRATRRGRAGRTTPAGAVVGLAVAVAAAVLGGCASTPPPPGRAPDVSRDGPDAAPPPDLAAVPDAAPRVEPIRAGGPNKPYEVAGRAYVPITQDAVFSQRGPASWYGRQFHGRRTSSGEVYNMYAMTAAHPTLPIPSYARIRNPANGREIVVRVNDRGPFKSERIVDLSYTAAWKLDLLRGVAPVELERITFEAIRTGAWRRGGPDEAAPRLAGAAPSGAAPDRPGAPAEAASSRPPATAAASADPAPDGPDFATAMAALPPPLPPVPATGGVEVSAALVAPVVAPVVATAPRPVDDAPAARAHTVPARGFWVQLGAFRQRNGVEALHRRVIAELEAIAPLLAVFDDPDLYRLQAGPYPNRDAARAAAERIRDALQLVPAIVERR